MMVELIFAYLNKFYKIFIISYHSGTDLEVVEEVHLNFLGKKLHYIFIGILKNFYVYVLILNFSNVRLEVALMIEEFEIHLKVISSNRKYYFFFSKFLNGNSESATQEIKTMKHDFST